MAFRILRRRGRARDRLALLGLSACLVLAAAGLAVVFHGLMQDAGPPAPSRPAGPPGFVAAPSSGPYSTFAPSSRPLTEPPRIVAAFVPRAALSEKIAERVAGAAPPAPPEPNFELSAPFILIDGRTFGTERWTVELPDIDGLARGAICLDKADRAFACGLQARAALNNMLRKGVVSCRTIGLAPDGAVRASCRSADGLDLSESMIRQGWARPVDRADMARLEMMEEARRQERGVWNGGWRLRAEAAPIAAGSGQERGGAAPGP